jgi:hypothetical protein
MGWLTLSLLQSAPALIAGIKSLEAALPGKGTGATKKAILLSAFVEAPAATQIALGAFVDSTVGHLKTAGALGTATEVATGLEASIGALASAVTPAPVI